MPNNKPGSRLIKAAGGVAWRPGPDGEPEILLVHRKKYDDWSLPKGKTEPGEPLPVTAVREVLEEGGASLALGRRLVSVRYNVGGRPKRVHYWAASVVSVDERAVPNSEVDEVEWVRASRAAERVSYAHDHGVLSDFTARPAQTVPLILLRHAKAVAKHGWKHSDAARPLDDSGRSDAKALADLLACFAPRPRLISSTAARCTETLRPLSQLTGEQVRVEQSLYIHNRSPITGSADTASDLAALVREAIASGEPTVICAHRENLPVLQEAALAALAGHSAVTVDDTASDGTALDGTVPGGAGPDGTDLSGTDLSGTDLSGTDLSGTDLSGTDLSGAASSGAVAAGGVVAELPKEWSETLPTSGFWVLNVAPLPPEPESAVAGAGPAAPEPAPRRRWWRRLRVRAGRAAGTRPPAGPAGPDDPDAAASGTGAGETGPADGAHGARAARPLGVLVSADRYDLAEA
jgi:8-oxo-dGTP pyrophosphatase MutT (NUDIX family)/phosphohistidine phosphatase SixA